MSEDGINIKVRYIAVDMPRLERIWNGNWIDLRASMTVNLLAGHNHIIPLGIAVHLPKGYEGIIAPRSSSYKNWGVIQVNSIGVIDESYSGDTDEWKWSVFATRNSTINKFDRVCQFRVLQKQPPITFMEVDTLGNPDRGGFGSTGVK